MMIARWGAQAGAGYAVMTPSGSNIRIQVSADACHDVVISSFGAAARLANENDNSEALALRRIIHRAVHGVAQDIEALRFNRAVAAIYELTNALTKAIGKGDALGDAQRQAIAEGDRTKCVARSERHFPPGLSISRVEYCAVLADRHAAAVSAGDAS